jgi:hypothetical protein
MGRLIAFSAATCGSLFLAGAQAQTVQDQADILFQTVSESIPIDVVPYGADPSGAADSRAAIHDACYNNPGKTIRLPKGTYLLMSDVGPSMPTAAPPCNIVADPGVTFTGSGHMPSLITNTLQKANANYLTSTFAGSMFGQTLGIEATGTAGYSGNAVALYAGMQVPSGAISGNYLVFNPVAASQAGSGGSVVNTEFDCNEFRANNYLGCMHIAGVGNYDPQYAIMIDYNGSTIGAHNWNIGQIIRSFNVGLLVDAAQNSASKPAAVGVQVVGVPNISLQVQGTGASSNVGLLIMGVQRNHIQIIPSDDSPGASIYGANAANSQVNWQITKAGQIMGSGFTAGSSTGVSCTGTPSSSFAVVGGIVTHC